jgi:outer membrane protein insertion porin family
VGVDEKSTGNFTFGAGFNTVESIFGYAEISQVNFDLFNPPYFTGGGQKFRLRVSLGTQLQDYLLAFEEPWFLNRKLRLGVDFYRRVEDYDSLDNLYNEARTGTHLSLTKALWTENLIGSVSYNLEDVGIENVSPNSPDTILRESGDNLFNRFGTSLAYDTRNSYEIANHGQETQIAGLFSTGDRNYYRVEAKTDWFFKTPFKGHRLELSAKAGVTQTVSGGDVPFYDRFYLGGQDSLRGFDYHGLGPREPTQDGTLYETIGGDTYWFASAEYTIPIIDRLAFAFFYDIGNVSAAPFSNTPFNVHTRTFGTTVGQAGTGSTSQGQFFQGNTGSYSDDFGIGLRLTIPTLGPLRLDYGIPLHRDSFNGPSGKFQFGAGFSRPL